MEYDDGDGDDTLVLMYISHKMFSNSNIFFLAVYREVSQRVSMLVVREGYYPKIRRQQKIIQPEKSGLTQAKLSGAAEVK